jgi:hypothetical protein
MTQIDKPSSATARCAPYEMIAFMCFRCETQFDKTPSSDLCSAADECSLHLSSSFFKIHFHIFPFMSQGLRD